MGCTTIFDRSAIQLRRPYLTYGARTRATYVARYKLEHNSCSRWVDAADHAMHADAYEYTATLYLTKFNLI